jgi:hypothetical protein
MSSSPKGLALLGCEPTGGVGARVLPEVGFAAVAERTPEGAHVLGTRRPFDGVGRGASPGARAGSECDTSPMSPQEKALEFMLFYLSACIQNDTRPPWWPTQ